MCGVSEIQLSSLRRAGTADEKSGPTNVQHTEIFHIYWHKFLLEDVGVDNVEHKPPVVYGFTLDRRVSYWISSWVGPLQVVDTPLDIAMHFGIGDFQHDLLENPPLQIPFDKALDIEW